MAGLYIYGNLFDKKIRACSLAHHRNFPLYFMCLSHNECEKIVVKKAFLEGIQAKKKIFCFSKGYNPI